MANPFQEYAQYYDLLYHDKDYRGEAHFVARLIQKHLDKPPGATDVLDLACGTGRHAQELAAMGYRVEGSDISADMIAVARTRAASLGLPIGYHNESFQSCDRIGRQYDAVIAMFSAIDYLTDVRELECSLQNIRGLLRANGIFLFDFWNGNAVLKQHSPTRVRRASDGVREVVRISNTELDPVAQVATVCFDFLLIENGHVIGEFSERHPIRYFFPAEMRALLSAQGLEVVRCCPFMDETRDIAADDWNLTYVARPC